MNDPNIVTIHEIGSEGGVSYIAMEHVEGSTLRELLAGAPPEGSRSVIAQGDDELGELERAVI